MPISLLVGLLAQASPCSWLTTGQLTKEFGGIPFQAAHQSVAVPAFAGQNRGTRCEFPGNGGTNVELVAYIDHSPDEAKSIFNTMKTYFPPESTPGGLGDDAYFDENHGLHVLKGQTRYLVKISSADPEGVADRHAMAVATMVASKI